ncbi:MAG: hypothetical protein IKW59_02735 [Clostridia bacterium]|nr:hypothetical protein [Clostridia bacterium]
MKTKKILSLLVCMLMLLSSLGIFTVSAETAVTEINVGKGVTYALPAAINSVNVTKWVNNDGTEVSNVDTSLVGYRYYTATLEDNTTVKYKVNIGEYKETMKDTFETYPETTYEALLENYAIDGGKIVKKDAYSADTANASTRFTKDGDNTVLQIGPDITEWGDMEWDVTDAKKGDAFKVSAKFKVVNFDPSTSSDTTNYFAEFRRKGMNGVLFRAKTNKSDEITATELRYTYSGGGNNVNLDEYVTWEPVASESVIQSMTDYVTIEMQGNSVQYSAFVNGDELVNSQSYSGAHITNNGFDLIRISKRYTKAQTNATVYIDDVTYSMAIYPTSVLSNVPVTTSLVQGDSANQTSTVKLEMSDGTEQEFTVDWTADTSKAATGLTAQGKIKGFDDTVTVTYNVVGTTTSEINTFVGADVELSDGTAVDTSKLGRKYYSVASADSVTKYTVNVGDWDVKREDDMSLHTNTTVDHDKNEETEALESVADTNSDGFPMTAWLNSNSTAGAVATKLDGNAVLKFTGKNPDSHIRWRLKDGFDGSFKYSMRMKIVADEATTSARQEALRINIYSTTSTSDYSYFYARVLTPKTGESTISFQPFRTNQQADTVATNVALAENSDGKWETEWFDIVVIGKADTGTRDIYVNGVLTHRDYMKYALKTASDVGEAEIEAAKITDCTFESVALGKTENNTMSVYVDDVSVSSYYKYEGNLPAGQEVLVGKDKAAVSEVGFTFSNGAVKNIPMTMPQLDTAKLGTYQTKAVLEGFDDATTVSAKVCNYDISSLAYKYGNEFTSAPLPGGTVYTAEVTNMSDDSKKATVFFAWYDSEDALKSVQPVDISGIDEGKTKTVEVNLTIPEDLSQGELAAANGYMKVFVLDDVSTIRPLDLAETFREFTYTAPRLFAAGDSTDQSYTAYRYPQAGVAQEYEHYFDGVEVYNYSSSGKSSATFISEKLWDKIVTELKSGDYVIIAFGHNDQSATTAADFEANIRKYIADAHAKGANPILRSPIARRKEGINGTAYYALNGDLPADAYNKPELAGKMDALLKVATELNVPFIDMIDISSKYLQSINTTEGNVTFGGATTDKATTKLYACDFCFNWDNEYASLRNWEDLTVTDGKAYSWANADFRYTHGVDKQDNTHPTIYGANVWAQKIVKEIKDKNLILSKYATNLDKTISYPTGEFVTE